MENEEGEVITRVEVDGYSYIDKLYLKSDGEEVKWTVSPSLPSGLSLGTTGIISGRVTTIIPETEFLFRATNSAGSSNSTFSLTVRGCSYGDYIYPKFLRISKGRFAIWKVIKCIIMKLSLNKLVLSILFVFLEYPMNMNSLVIRILNVRSILLMNMSCTI